MDKKLKQNLLLIAFGVALYAALMNFSTVWGFAKGLVSLALPLVIGFVLAFVLNVPMTGFEKLFGRIFGGAGKPKLKKMVRVISLLLTIVCVILVVVLVCTLIIPELVASAKDLYELVKERWPDWMAKLQDFFVSNNIDATWLNEWLAGIDIESMVKNILSGTGSVISSAFSIFSTAVSSVSTIAIGCVLAIYVLLCKDELARQSQKLLRAYVKDSVTDYFIHAARLTGKTYSKFLSGQCVEACILGSLIFIAFSIAGIPYASITGVLTAVCAFIPYVGAFISCFIGALLVLLAEPGKLLLCVILYLAVQFVENQFIYPHVVGTSVGLGAMWTLIAVILGGKLMGLLGMIFFIPLTAVIMSLLREHTNKTLERKEQAKTPPAAPPAEAKE